MQLHVRVLEALDIAKMDISKSDPYCVISVTSSNDTRKTRVIENSLKPVWNEDFHFNIPNPSNAALKILMRDKDLIKDDDMASLEVQLCSLPPGQVIDQWYNMIPAHHVKKGGRIHLILHLSPTGAPAFQNVPMGQPGYPPQQGYAAPPPGYAPPPQGYAPPPPGYAPQPGYAAPPPQGYAAPPPQGYAAPPPQGYAAPPPQGYAAPPPQGYAAPPPGYVAPAPGVNVPGLGPMPARPAGMSEKDYKKMTKPWRKALKKAAKKAGKKK
ncbi:C2 domain containing protein [Histomonas meleagridis]|uniref:C2 domain containing protein n=1 Tax=Histomonas meleagridis TaxID=135588 RepID=UPI0035599C81|nr:C2 domain containing protein [Histomonas meleagridis]KAH0806841.1 C2 domain containing protein [Histomonas meleagridis]